jgi:ABC-type multidrug transport system fused ATPase/permease subunit
LHKINLVIKRGQKVALVGPNGSGKTTCINLLDRFLDRDSGHIRFDGADICDFSVASVRDQISLVTQDAVVFALSAYENIAYGQPRAGMDQVVAAAKKAHAHEFIEQLPDGYQTVLGEFGATLSGGERQRLSLARAILRDAPIFIFDEATSQIDVDSERKIHKATSEFMRGRTSIVIAHRIRTIIDADQIAVFDRGRVIDVGTHDDLLKRCELYRTLYHAHTDPQ